jgi:polysaccharide export outer membrane protein
MIQFIGGKRSLTALAIGFALVSWNAAQAEGHSEINAEASEYQRPAYTVNPGDQLSISVWKEEGLQRVVIVRPDGAFSFPLTGDIRAEGRSIEQIEQAVTDKLEKYIPDPVVSIATEQVSGNRVYVIGQVARAGQYTAGAQLDVMQALALGGGMTAFANRDKIKILRRVEGKMIAIPFDYSDVEKGKRLNQNIILEPGDVVVVP